MQIKGNNIIVADSETRSIELETRLFLGSDTDTNLTFGIDCSIQHIQFMDVVQDWDGVAIPLIQHHRNIVDILLFLKAVT